MSSEPAQTLQAVELVRSRTNEILHHFSFPCMVFGAAMVIGAVIGLIAGGAVAGRFWIIAGPAGGIATAVYYARRESRIGATSNAAPWVVTSLVIMAGCLGTGFGGAALNLPVLSMFGPLLFISGGYLVFGRLAQSPALSVSAAILTLTVLVAWLAGANEQTGHIVSGLYGVVTFGIGFLNRRNEVRV